MTWEVSSDGTLEEDADENDDNDLKLDDVEDVVERFFDQYHV